MTERPAFWFPVKRYGWGWGLPICWQGWVVFIGYLAALIGGLRYLAAQRAAVPGILLYCAALTALLVAIIAVKGQRPLRWRWGGE